MFSAEKMISGAHVYHKKCFSCKECERPLDSFSAKDAPDGKDSRVGHYSNLDVVQIYL